MIISSEIENVEKVENFGKRVGKSGKSTLRAFAKGQLISKPIYDLLTSPKKRTDEFDLFTFLLFTANKSNSSVRFFGESTASQSAF
jgi:hypothetical protein